MQGDEVEKPIISKTQMASRIRPVDFAVPSGLALQVDGLWKQYRLGAINHGTLSSDLRSWWARACGRPDPNLKVDQQVGGGQAAGATGSFWALKDINLEIKSGEVVGLIGGNGAGKSTLLKIISRVTTPTRGEVRIRGQVASLLEVGTGFHPELTGRENVFLNGAILGMSKGEIQGKLDEIVSFSEIERFIDTPVKRYSSGMFLRLAFSVAAHLEAEVLLVDEILAVGDAAFRRKCMGKMDHLTQKGRTILFVSHNISQIRRICSRAVWLEQGTIQELGPTDQVTLAYETDRLSGSQRTADRFVRTGEHNPHVWIKAVDLKDADGTSTSQFRYGDDLCFDVHLEYGEDFDLQGIKDMALVWILTDDADTRISADSMLHHELSFSCDTRTVRCRLPCIPLYKGGYRLELGITHESFDRLDTWKDDVRFEIVRCDPVRRGFERNHQSGFVHLGSQWETLD